MSYSKPISFIVYKVTSPNNKIYIGITSQGLDKRRQDHYSEAKTHKTNRKFHNALNKYKDQLIWEILKTGLSKKLAQKYEEYYIKKFKSQKFGYNTTNGGECNLGRIMSEEQKQVLSKLAKKQFEENPWMKQNMSEIQKKRLSDPKENKKHRQMLKNTHGTKEARLQNSKLRGGKPFNVYNFITKEFVKTYEIITDANLELGLPNGKVSWCLSGKRNHCKTYIFKYIDDPTVNGVEYNKIWDKKIKRKPNGIK